MYLPSQNKGLVASLNFRETKGLAIKPFFKDEMEAITYERFRRRKGRHIAVVILTRWAPY